MDIRWYDSLIVRHKPDSHRRISLEVTYTISYGEKRIDIADQLKGGG